MDGTNTWTDQVRGQVSNDMLAHRGLRTGLEHWSPELRDWTGLDCVEGLDWTGLDETGLSRSSFFGFVVRFPFLDCAAASAFGGLCKRSESNTNSYNDLDNDRTAEGYGLWQTTGRACLPSLTISSRKMPSLSATS